MEKKCVLMTKSAQAVARKYWPEMKHSDQVRKLSLQLFDALQDLHKLGRRERCWLECAAILHDIGLSLGSRAHHKASLNLILNDKELPFTSVERRVIADIASYHRKGCPKNTDYNFTSLNRELKRKVSILAGILRLADGLDFSHQSIVQGVEAHVAFENVILQGSVFLNAILEEHAINKKKDLFEKAFKKNIVVTWKQIQPLGQQSQTTPILAEQSTLPSAENFSNSPTLNSTSANKPEAEQQDKNSSTN
jgi:exopolyphosphatase/guanosine-5'-triphosphate,3'-diphosphate pyrophosphatase